MRVKQISIFLENKTGRLFEALNALAKESINIRALSIADTAQFGILRLIVNDPDKAKIVLDKSKFTVKESDVIAVGLDDKPGEIVKTLDILQKAKIGVEYLYAFAERKDKHAIVIIKTESIDEGIKALKNGGATVLAAKEVYNL